MKELLADEFQYMVNELLVRSRSILDLITKFQDSNARVNRTIVKSVTQCGCIQVNAKKQALPEDDDLEEMRNAMETHLEGKLCDECRDFIEKDIGRNLFYLASICNTLDLNLYDIIIKEHGSLKLLGKYNLR